MNKQQLAQELRERQYKQGAANLAHRRTIDTLSDDKIIDSYITCSCCGNKQVLGKDLECAIQDAIDVNDFFGICDRAAIEKHEKKKH